MRGKSASCAWYFKHAPTLFTTKRPCGAGNPLFQEVPPRARFHATPRQSAFLGAHAPHVFRFTAHDRRASTKRSQHDGCGPLPARKLCRCWSLECWCRNLLHPRKRILHRIDGRRPTPDDAPHSTRPPRHPNGLVLHLPYEFQLLNRGARWCKHLVNWA